MVQALTQAAGNGSIAAELQSVVPAILQQCQQWVHHNSKQQAQPGQQQQPQQQPNASDQLDAAVRWRNRCLRSILAATATVNGAAATGSTGSTGAGWQSSSGQLAAWLPQQCWQPLQAIVAGAQLSTSSSTGAGQSLAGSSCGAAPWSLLSPAWQAQHWRQQQQLAVYDGSTVSNRIAGQITASIQPTVALCYQDPQELLQHNKNVQKLQQLLLHLHVELHLAPRLIECLLRGCLVVHQERTDERAQQQGQQAGRQAEDKCWALYRVLHFLTAASAKQRGLGGSCLVAEPELVADAGLLEWG